MVVNKMKTIDIQLTQNFKLSEFCTTSQDFDNFEIPYGYLENLRELSLLLQKVRDAINKPIHISSGFRPERLNTMVDGVKNSFHLVGAAADIYFSNYDDYKSAWNYLEYIFKFSALYDIAELLGCPESNWLHISINNNYREYKHIIKPNFY